MKAFEQAEDMEFVVILYQNKKECETTAGFITDQSATIADTNYLIDHFKAWLFQTLYPKEHAE